MKKALLISSLSALVVIGGGFAAFAIETPIPTSWVSSSLEAIATREAIHVDENGFSCGDFEAEAHFETYNINTYGNEVGVLNEDLWVKKTSTEDGFVLDGGIRYNHSSGEFLNERYVAKGDKHYHCYAEDLEEKEITSEEFEFAFIVSAMMGFCCDEFGAFRYKEQLLHPDYVNQSWGNLYVHKTTDDYRFTATIDLFTKRLKEIEYLTEKPKQIPPVYDSRTITRYVFH